jgi:hypothetical protein
MAKKKEDTKPEVKELEGTAQVKKPRSIITMATDGQTVSSPIKTTRELYMEQVDAKKD